MARGAPVLSGSARRMAAGRRDTSVAIQHLTAEPTTGSGYPMETWVTRSPQVLMNRMDVRADEHFSAAQTSAFVETIWQMPYMRSMDPDLVDVPKTRRLVVSGRVYDIRTATAIGRQRGIELLTLAGSRLPAVVS